MMKKYLVFIQIAGLALSANGSTSIEASDPYEVFEAVKDSNESGRSDTWGSLDFSEVPWIYTSSFGWIYLSSDATPENYWFWINGLGWLNSSATQFPLCHMIGSNPSAQDGLVLLDYTDRFRFKYWHFGDRQWRTKFRPDTVIQGAPQWYFDYLDSGFRPDNEEDLLLYQFYGSVPDHLVGLVAQDPYIEESPSEYGYTQIRIGAYLLLKIDYALRGSYRTTVFTYDQFNDVFYPAERRIGNDLSPVVGNDHLRAHVEGDELIIEILDGRTSTYKIISDE